MFMEKRPNTFEGMYFSLSEIFYLFEVDRSLRIDFVREMDEWCRSVKLRIQQDIAESLYYASWEQNLNRNHRKIYILNILSLNI